MMYLQDPVRCEQPMWWSWALASLVRVCGFSRILIAELIVAGYPLLWCADDIRRPSCACAVHLPHQGTRTRLTVNTHVLIININTPGSVTPMAPITFL